MSIKEEYTQKRSDYERLKELCGRNNVNDLCGAWCNTEQLFAILENPTKRKAISMYSSLITAYLNMGYDKCDCVFSIDVLDAEVYEILKRNGDVD